MANEEHLKLLNQGAYVWNAWKREHPNASPDFTQATLTGAKLSGVDLNGADLFKADLSAAELFRANLGGANLFMADLSWADLSKADLSKANISRADLTAATLSGAKLAGANLSEAKLFKVDLTRADLTGADLDKANLNGADLKLADLTEAHLTGVDFAGAILSEANFSGASVGWTVFGNTDLSSVKQLERVRHRGPSTIGVDTLYLSQGHIPEIFLRDAGLPEEFITQIPALVASVRPIQFQSCFISHSHWDEEFAKRLHSALRRENLRVWFAPEEMKAGEKLHDQIFQAIQVHDRLLLVMSKDSMKSEWVITEIKRAKKVERDEQRRKLFPIRLIDFEAIQKWECFDTDSGKDLAAEVREYYIPDFSNWKDHDSFESEFAKLLRDLRATQS